MGVSVSILAKSGVPLATGPVIGPTAAFIKVSTQKMPQRTDYLVKGCGASAMAFVDVMLRETDATFTMVDRRAAPGGHWNDAYQFVRLHQPSPFYGVPSRPLGHGRIDTSGFNAGFHELASGYEVADHFHQVMQEVFLPSGRVTYCPMSELADGDEIVSLLSGQRQRVEVTKAQVDATFLHTNIPLTHRRKFEVAAGIACIPPNDLVRLAPEHARFTVLGGGKTALDSVSWLLANGAPASAISWVVPRDAWLVNRKLFQPGDALLAQTLNSVAAQFEVCASARTLRQLCEGMEAAGNWLRLDPNVWPAMLHGATITAAELERLRSVGTIIRHGHLQRIEHDRMMLSEGEVPTAPHTLYIDCTAAALAHNVGRREPAFAPGKINLQMIRVFQPTFSAALIGHIEATVADPDAKRRYTEVTPMTDNVADWVRAQVTTLTNQNVWMSNAEMRSWIRGCRLDPLYAALTRVRATEPEKRAAVQRLRAASGPALENLMRLAASQLSE
jgi:hypothetical protein